MRAIGRDRFEDVSSRARQASARASHSLSTGAGRRGGGGGSRWFLSAVLFIAASVAFAEDPPGTITTVAGTGLAGFSGDGGPATSARLNSPFGVCAGPGGVLYICDWRNHRV